MMSFVPQLATVLRGIAAASLMLFAATGTAQNDANSATQMAPRAAIEELLGQFDEHFANDDIDGYLARFEADHEGALAMFGMHMRKLRTCTRDGVFASKILAGPTLIGNRTMVRVRHEVIWPEVGGQSIRPTHAEDSYLVVRLDEQGKIVPTFAIEMPVATECVRGGKFRCPACNYEIGGVDGWLCVPLPRARSLALESATFYLIGTDIACDVSVLVEPKPVPAQFVVQRMAHTFAHLEPTAEVGLPEKWLPPSHKQNTPEGLDASRLEVKLPNDDAHRGGGRAVFHIVTFGGLQHLLFVRGNQRSLDEQQAQLTALFKSYMLLEVDCSLAEAAARPLRHHIGGSLTKSVYKNSRYGIELRGPEQWESEQRVGGVAFRVRWSGPKGSRMWLIGHAVPSGMSKWTTDAADHWLDEMFGKRGLEVVADDKPEWRDVANGQRKVMTLQARSPKDPASPRRRIVCVQVHDDLLVLCDGHGSSTDDESAIRAAIESLNRR